MGTGDSAGATIAVARTFGQTSFVAGLVAAVVAIDVIGLLAIYLVPRGLLALAAAVAGRM